MYMKQKFRQGWALLLVCAMLYPLAALGEDGARDWEAEIAEMQARMQALEAELEALRRGTDADDQVPESIPFAVEETLSLGDGKTMAITGYDTGTRFRYSPSGGLSLLSLSAKSGYRLLCLYVSLENNTDTELLTAPLLNSQLAYGKTYTNKAQSSFFYRNRNGFSSGLKAVGPKTTVEGCLLFAVPESMETSNNRIAVRFVIEDTYYECELRPAGTIVDTLPAEQMTGNQ